MTGDLLGTGADLTSVFAALPVPCALLTPQLVVLEVSRAYEQVVGRRRDQVVGRRLLDAHPEDPRGTARVAAVVEASLLRVLDTAVAEPVPLQQYDLPSREDPTRYEERWWSYTTHPVIGAYGQVAALLLVTEDVTATVTADDGGQSGTGGAVIDLRSRAEQLHADVYARAQQLHTATLAREVSARRLSALAEVALELVDAEGVDDLAEAVIGRGLRALGCDSGSIAVPDPRWPGQLVSTVLDEAEPGGLRTLARVPLTHQVPLVAAFTSGERVVLADRASALAWSPVMEQVLLNTGVQALACLPMVVGGRVLGVLTATWNTAHSTADAEMALLEAYAAQGAQTLDRITARALEREAAAAVAGMAETLQRSLLTSLVEPDHLEVRARYLPAAHHARVGGDWYDAFVVDGCLHLVIGDVGGHDRDAAAAMGQLRNLLRGITYAATDHSPAQVLTTLEGAVHDLSVDTLATLLLGRVEQPPELAASSRRVLRWSNAGHPPPLLVHRDGRAELLEAAPDLLLGVEAGTDRHEHTVVLDPGATLVCYTDGLVERRGHTLDEGIAWLRATVEALSGLPVDALCDGLLAGLPEEVEDDIALLVVRAGRQRR